MQMIIVNGKRKKIPAGAITHSALCALALGPDEDRDNAKFEVTFINGAGMKTGAVKAGSGTTPVREQNFTVVKADAKPATGKGKGKPKEDENGNT